MTPQEYCLQALQTEAVATESKMMSLNDNFRLLHGGLGLSTEVGEFLDQIKRHIFYGKPLDKLNLQEEVGDIMWYVGLICNCQGFDLEEIMKKNISKLRLRFPNNFTNYDALNRDVKKELEGSGLAPIEYGQAYLSPDHRNLRRD